MLNIKISKRRDKMLKGYKTYVVGTCMILYGLIGTFLDLHDYNSAAGFVSGGLVAMGLRDGINSKI